MKMIKSLVRDESGATAIEYGLIAGLIAVAVIGILVTLGPQVATQFKSISDKLPAAAT